jgi:S-adenosylmethionine hydrolase
MMAELPVTLTTDFGAGSTYVAAVKGAILSVNAQARVLDLSHAIPPQDLRYAAFFLAAAVPYFPAGTLHVVVVDPGVGTSRAILYVEVGGQRLLVPDNGCWTTLGRPARAFRLSRPQFWRSPVSATFHGRDIFAPVAGHLSRGLDPALLGPPADDWARLDVPQPAQTGNVWQGEVVFIDGFGNLLTNLPAEALPPPGAGPVALWIGDTPVPRRVQTYGDAEAGALVALVSSLGTLEIAVNQGSAAVEVPGAAVGMPVRVQVG